MHHKSMYNYSTETDGTERGRKQWMRNCIFDLRGKRHVEKYWEPSWFLGGMFQVISLPHAVKETRQIFSSLSWELHATWRHVTYSNPQWVRSLVEESEVGSSIPHLCIFERGWTRWSDRDPLQLCTSKMINYDCVFTCSLQEGWAPGFSWYNAKDTSELTIKVSHSFVSSPWHFSFPSLSLCKPDRLDNGQPITWNAYK